MMIFEGLKMDIASLVFIVGDTPTDKAIALHTSMLNNATALLSTFGRVSGILGQQSEPVQLVDTTECLKYTVHGISVEAFNEIYESLPMHTVLYIGAVGELSDDQKHELEYIRNLKSPIKFEGHSL